MTFKEATTSVSSLGSTTGAGSDSLDESPHDEIKITAHATKLCKAFLITENIFNSVLNHSLRLYLPIASKGGVKGP
ncbi:hypothetical protein [Pontibacter harenae]|uniref:hypothetical protein n=1 Tax=Pontibacter harenae TaxID=2894083 RepID=UPI001E3BB51F|nr:hypothetical protein [Pontibacter harenae]MCC9168434.1 hypothetical protein [Pontibacter harenae]